LDIVDGLARGYIPRVTVSKSKNKKKKKDSYKAPLNLPYISEATSNKIRNYI
jgi:hypothetical protein